MPQPALRRLSLVLALAGALVIVLQLSAGLYLQYGGASLPRFQKSAPQVPDWPGHFYLPVG